MASIVVTLLLSFVCPCGASQDYYGLLGVTASASHKDISAAFRKLSLQWHPDKNPSRREDAELRMRELSEAYSVLSKADDRRVYDAVQPKQPKQSQGYWAKQPKQSEQPKQGHWAKQPKQPEQPEQPAPKARRDSAEAYYNIRFDSQPPPKASRGSAEGYYVRLDSQSQAEAKSDSAEAYYNVRFSSQSPPTARRDFAEGYYTVRFD